MRTHDDRPGGAGGYGAHAQRPPAGAPGAQVSRTQGLPGQGQPGRRHNYYDDDDGYSDADATSLVEQGRDGGYEDEVGHTRKPFKWNGGTDFGLLVLRLALGGIFLAHGAQECFGALGGPGPQGFAQTLSDMGFQQSATLALVTGGTELGAGALLVLGLFTPVAAAGVVGLMAAAVAVMLGKGFFADTGGFELEATLGLAGVAILFTGPGRIALDYGRVWFRRPAGFGFVFLIIALAAAAAVVVLFHRA